MPVNAILKDLIKATRAGLLSNPQLHEFLYPVFPDEQERYDFIRKALRKLRTQRMLNHANWYLTMADSQERVSPGKPALKLIFLMALAEYITKTGNGNSNISSAKAIQDFFNHISIEDKATLRRGIRRALLSVRNKELRFSSLIQILYNVRNKAVHGEDYYSFSLPTQQDKAASFVYTHWGNMTTGTLKSKPRKRGGKRKATRVNLEATITYEDLREIFRRTAVANIIARF